MPLTLDQITIATTDPAATREFYCTTFGLTPADALDLHGAGALSFAAPTETSSDTGSFVVLSYVVEQPTEVTWIFDAAVAAGATALKAPKKGLFGGFAASFGAPDGTLWKIASPNKKDKGAASVPPRPTEVVALLGVPEIPDTRAFYVHQGLQHDNDYGKRFVDFAYTPPSFKIGVIPAKALAKDIGVQPDATSNLTFGTRSNLDGELTDPGGNRWVRLAE